MVARAWVRAGPARAGAEPAMYSRRIALARPACSALAVSESAPPLLMSYRRKLTLVAGRDLVEVEGGIWFDLYARGRRTSYLYLTRSVDFHFCRELLRPRDVEEAKGVRGARSSPFWLPQRRCHCCPTELGLQDLASLPSLRTSSESALVEASPLHRRAPASPPVRPFSSCHHLLASDPAPMSDTSFKVCGAGLPRTGELLRSSRRPTSPARAHSPRR